MRQHPLWPLWESIGLTLACDAAVMGEEGAVPAQALANAMPDGLYRTLEGQSHEVSPQALAPVLVEFFKA